MNELQEQFMDDDGIIEAYGRLQGVSPEDVLIAKEKMLMVIQIYHKIARVLTADELEIFIQYIVEERPYVDIGRINTGRFKPRTAKEKQRLRRKFSATGSRKVKSITAKLKKLDISEEQYEALQANPSEETIGEPKYHLGWPVESLQRVNAGSHWVYPKKKKPKYRHKAVCMIPEYLAGAFDTETKCPLCGIKCTRKEVN